MGFGLSRSRLFEVFLLVTEQAMSKERLADDELVRDVDYTQVDYYQNLRV
jgi:hypothetical protein